MDPKYFAEGITKCHDKLYQLTYKENEVVVYNITEFDGEYKITIDEIKGMPKNN